jgi:hypothetical protein
VANGLLVQSDSTLADSASRALNVSATVLRPCSGLDSRNKDKHLAVRFDREAINNRAVEEEIF